MQPDARLRYLTPGRTSRRARTVMALAIAAAALCGFSPAQAQWKWRDAQGRIQYSDLPPPSGVPDKDVLSRPPGSESGVITLRPVGAPPASAPAQVTTPAPKPAAAAASRPGEDARKREADEAAAARRQAEENAKIQAENCRRAREYARTLESGMRVARMNEKGEREVLDDTQRQQELQRSRDIISQNCR